MSGVPAQTLAWVEREVGPVRRIEPMPEASHTNHRVTTDAVVAVIRRYTDTELLGDDPWYVPSAEIQALEAVARTEVPAPGLLAADPDAFVCDVPTLLLTWMPGSPGERPDDVTEFVRGLARSLPALHRGPLVPRAYESFLASDGERLEDLRPPSCAGDPRVWERAFELAAGEPPGSPAHLIHRDYHPGNTLWEDGRLSGVIDWTHGCSGPLGIDLAQMRVNLAWELDFEVAEAFLDAWREVADDPAEHHPYWDLLDAVDWLGDGEPNEPFPDGVFERYEAFVARSVAELGG